MHQPGLISAQSCQNGPTYLAAPPGAPISHGSNAIACVLATKPSCVPTLSRGGGTRGSFEFLAFKLHKLETRHGPDDARRSLQVLRCKLVDRLIVFFFANRIVGEPSAAGNLDTWPNRPGPMLS